MLVAAIVVSLGILWPGPARCQMLLNGAGATFPYPIYSKWFNEYLQVDPSVQFNYQSIGSGGGIKQITEETVDFGASDGPMTDEQLKTAPGHIMHFPTVLGADVLTYNVEGLATGLKVTSEILAGIFLGKVTKWNDPLLAAANPGIKLPDNDMVVVHRSDGSGTTYIWTDYLSKVSTEWSEKVGRGTSVNWPVGLGGKGNEGVTGLVKQTPNSIGYVELIYAVSNQLPFADVKNSAGSFVKPSLESVTAAAAELGQNMPEDFRVSITNGPGRDVYPISSMTWLLVYEKQKDTEKGKKLVQFLNWMMHDGQKYSAPLQYAALPKEVVAKEEQALRRVVSIDGKPLLEK
jgi:phosphate transport system substrate-binding protein